MIALNEFKMKLLSIVLVLALGSFAKAEDQEALRECGNLHHMEFRNFPNAKAEYSNKNCKLKCEVGEKVLSEDSMNEGYPCPVNPHGVS